MSPTIDNSRLQALIAQRRDGHSLPRAFYFDEQIYASELARIWRRGWLFAGHTCQIPEPGDFFVYELDTDSILILRDDDDQIRAVHNLCRHRGTLLCDVASGHVGRLVCPYHQWTYGRDGSLLSARGMDEDLDVSEYGLLPVQLQVVAGFIFVSLASEPLDFESVGRRILELAGPQGFGRAKVAKMMDYEIAANWKLVWENNRECYHCNVNHPQYIKANFDHFNDDDRSLRIQQRMEQQVARSQQKWTAAGLAVTHSSSGMAPFPDPDDDAGWCGINRTPMADGYVSESMDGNQVAPLMGDYTDPDVGTLRIRTMPNMWNHSSCDHAVTTRLTPAGLGKTSARVLWLVDQDAEEGRDYALDELLPFWQLTSEQDWELCARAQRGVQSSAYRPGPLSRYKEYNVDAFGRWYAKQLTVSGPLRSPPKNRCP